MTRERHPPLLSRGHALRRCSPRFISEAERGKAGASIGLILQLGRELGLKFGTYIHL